MADLIEFQQRINEEVARLAALTEVPTQWIDLTVPGSIVWAVDLAADEDESLILSFGQQVKRRVDLYFSSLSNEALDILFGGQDARIAAELVNDPDFDMDELVVLEEFFSEEGEFDRSSW